jgi:hypothetical protein
MRILLDHCVPQPLRRYCGEHTAETTAYRGWQELSNGALLQAAEQAGFDVFLTIDQNLSYQQNLNDRHICVLILEAENNLAATLAPLMVPALQALEQMQPGEVRRIRLTLSETE